MTDEAPSPVVEVFADLGCPFTHVGLRRFVERRAERGRGDVHLLVRSWPLEVVNGTPLDADFIAEEVDDIRAAVAPDLFTGFAATAFPASSIPGLALAAAIDGVGVALASKPLVEAEVAAGRLVMPFDIVIRPRQAYYLVVSEAVAERPTVSTFRKWLLGEAAKVREG